MIDEHKVKLFAEEIEAGKSGQRSALFQVPFNPPCVLHMHMRNAIKIVTVLIWKGLESDLENILFDPAIRHIAAICKATLRQVCEGIRTDREHLHFG